MEKKYYNTPEVKCHHLRIKSVMQAATTEIPYNPEDGADEEAGAKGGMRFFYDDEDE